MEKDATPPDHVDSSADPSLPPLRPVVNKRAYKASIIYCWENGKKFEAMKLLWRDYIVDCPPTRRLVDALDKNDRLYVLGHGAASKTFTTVAFRLLQWYMNPTETAILLTSATRTSLASRAWADLKLLHKKVAVPMPGTILASQYKLRYDHTDDKHTITGVSGEDEDSESKLRGLHAKYNHLIIDEADNPYNVGVWKSMANFGISGEFTLVALTNPVDRNSVFGERCEPETGWDSLDINSSFSWKAKSGVPIIRLDGLESPNITAGKTIYPFLITQKGIDDIVNEFGTNSAVYMTQVRGFFPPTGSFSTIFNSQLTTVLINNDIKFYGDSTPVAACDPSLGGGDRCVVIFGRAGLLADDPTKGCVIWDEMRYVKRSVTSKFPTVDFAEQIKALCMERNVEPKNFAIDSSSATQGIADYMAEDWDPRIVRVNFGGACSKGKILQEDTRSCADRFDRFVTELWWTGREWTRAGQVSYPKIGRDLRIQLESRRWEESKGQKNKISVESKDEMKRRGLKSPDEGDVFNLGCYLVKGKFGTLDATGLAHDPAVRKIAPTTLPADNRALFEPQYRHDQVLSGRTTESVEDPGGDDDWRYSQEAQDSQDLD